MWIGEGNRYKVGVIRRGKYRDTRTERVGIKRWRRRRHDTNRKTTTKQLHG